MPAGRFESYLPEMALLIGQSDMPKPRLDRAPKLRAIINVETNFLQNVDYDLCFERGVHVLAPGSAFAKPVAEMALGMAIDLCRGVTNADRAMRACAGSTTPAPGTTIARWRSSLETRRLGQLA